jgi:hypothetical protein
MKSVRYIAKEDLKPYLQAIEDGLGRVNLSPLGYEGLLRAVLNGEMFVLGFFNDEKLDGAMVVQPRVTDHGDTAFIYAYFGKGVVNPEYYEKLSWFLKAANFEYIQGYGTESALRLYQKSAPLKEEYRDGNGGLYFGGKL